MVRQADLENLRELDQVWTELQEVATYREGNITTGGDERDFVELRGRAQILYGKTNQFIDGIYIRYLDSHRDCFLTVLGLPAIRYWRQPFISEAWTAGSFAIKQALGSVEAQLEEQEAHGGDEVPHTSLDSLHPDVSIRSRGPFESGRYDDAIFNAMKAVEDKLRKMIGGSDEDIGLALVSKALNPKRPLLSFSKVTAEQEAFQSLFRGALGAFKNPLSHRFLDTLDPLKTLEILALASLLIRLLGEATLEAGAAE